jgi:anaerobic dimethyl sulfoxide reductase subunit A
LASITDWKRTQYGSPIPLIPKWVEPREDWVHGNKAKTYPFHMVSPHPRQRTHSIFYNVSWLKEAFAQEITINASDARRLDIKTGDIVEVWNDRGKVVVPAYVTERIRPGIMALYEGAWMDLDENGVDRAGNPDFLTADMPSPAGAFAYNNALVNVRKTQLEHRPGWDDQAASKSHVFRRDL